MGCITLHTPWCKQVFLKGIEQLQILRLFLKFAESSTPKINPVTPAGRPFFYLLKRNSRILRGTSITFKGALISSFAGLSSSPK